MNPHVSVITLGVGDLYRTWGGSSGYFADPDGFLWKVAFGGGDDQPFAQ